METVSLGKYQCPYCSTTVSLASRDMERWNNIIYYKCPTCKETPHIKGGNFICPIDIQGKKAKRID